MWGEVEMWGDGDRWRRCVRGRTCDVIPMVIGWVGRRSGEQQSGNKVTDSVYCTCTVYMWSICYFVVAVWFSCNCK